MCTRGIRDAFKIHVFQETNTRYLDELLNNNVYLQKNIYVL